MDKYRRIPTIVEAIQYFDNFSVCLKIDEWTGSVTDPIWINPGVCFIHTLEGDMHVTEGDWIIKGVNGEYYPCKPDIFAKLYELVE